jgi:alcohol dehydrogenase class IV
MEPIEPIEPFEYDNAAGAIRFGRGSAGELASVLGAHDVERALVVCGANVGANRGTMAPIEGGLDGRLAGVFDETTPAKSARTAIDGVEAMRSTGADGIVAVGGGSSVDVARAMRAIHADGRPYGELHTHAADTGALPVPEADLAPLVAVPTTLAGADLSAGRSVTFDADDAANADGRDAGGDGSGGGGGADADGDGADRDGGADVVAGFSDPALLPEATVYDPDLFETTPTGALVGSAMNGFDKGLELPYSRHANPLTDAAALRGLGLLRSSLPRLREHDDPAVMDAAVAGIVCVQYGRVTRGPGLLSIVHAFWHGLREQGVQQGVAHAVMAPPVLDYLFSAVDGRRDLLADALGAGDGRGSETDDLAGAVVEAVRAVRDGLELPARLRELEAVDREALPAVAEAVHGDRFLDNGPAGLDPSVADVGGVLEDAW